MSAGNEARAPKQTDWKTSSKRITNLPHRGIVTRFKAIAPLKSIRRLLGRSNHVKNGRDPTAESGTLKKSGGQKSRYEPSFSVRPTTDAIATSGGITYTEDELLYLASEVKDFQITHGSLLKVVQYETESSVRARPVGASILPTNFPRKQFEEATELQQVFNELYVRVASDPAWLYSVLEPLIEQDEFISALWDVYMKIKETNAVQQIVCGIFRSDYMLHKARSEGDETDLKQVEINTYFCAGACHAERIANMHRHLGRVRGLSHEDISRHLPENKNTTSLVKLLKNANDTYSSTISRNENRQKCVLMVVQPLNFNTADERPIEYALWDAGLPCYRCEWQTVLQATTLAEDLTLSFRPSIGNVELEISVVYYRAGFGIEEYGDEGKETRIRLEMSRAIKCPDILTHLTNSKAIQQALSLPGALERFLTPEKCEKIRKTFMPMYTLDSSPKGPQARAIAQDPKQAVNYVLKPNRDGGGHNIYGSDIPGFLSDKPQSKWRNYVLMRLIEPPATTGMLMMPEDLYTGDVISELGILGTCLWRRDASEEGESKVGMIKNEVGGFTFKTKPREVDEMSVVKGYGCFDCPFLLE